MPLLIVLGAVALLFVWAHSRAQARMNAAPIGDTQATPKTQPRGAPGSQIAFERGPDVLPDCIPHLRKTHDFIPSSGFDAMTRIGNINQPQLLWDPALFKRFRTAPIRQPEVGPQKTPNLPPEHRSEFEDESVMRGGYMVEYE